MTLSGNNDLYGVAIGLVSLTTYFIPKAMPMDHRYINPCIGLHTEWCAHSFYWNTLCPIVATRCHLNYATFLYEMAAIPLSIPETATMDCRVNLTKDVQVLSCLCNLGTLQWQIQYLWQCPSLHLQWHSQGCQCPSQGQWSSVSILKINIF